MSLLLQSTCRECKKAFTFSPAQFKRLGFDNRPQRCPECLDKAQNRPYQVLGRREIFTATCSAATMLPTLSWEEYTGGAKSRRRQVRTKTWHSILTGSQFGSDWTGRVDIWWHGDALPTPNQLINIRVMEVDKRVRLRNWSRQTLEYGILSGWRRVPINDDSGENIPGFNLENTQYKIEPDRISCETDTYVYLEPSLSSDTSKALVIAVASSVQNCNRNYHQRLEGQPYWKFELTRGTQLSTSRKTACWLAVVDSSHSISVTHIERGDERVIARYPAAYPERLSTVQSPWAEEPLADWERELMQ